MSWFHLIFGVLLFITFTVTGKFMRVDFPDKDAIPQELRLLMRSRHIYILFSALIHLMLGVYLRIRPELAQKILQYSGSIILIASSVLLVWAFITETYSLQHFSDISRNGDLHVACRRWSAFTGWHFAALTGAQASLPA